ncbi:MAG: hypothetical protein AB1540_01270 [Bdellovibrionota bacterium]
MHSLRMLLWSLFFLNAFPTALQPAAAAESKAQPRQTLTRKDHSRPNDTAKSQDLGLGVMFGEPSGITLKSWNSPTTAFDLALSYSFFGFFEILGDYLWHFPRVFKSDQFIPYLGAGGVLFFDTSEPRSSNNRFFRSDTRRSVGFGVRVPVGIEFLPQKVPLGVFAEIAPGVGLAPSTFTFLDGSIGARYYF